MHIYKKHTKHIQLHSIQLQGCMYDKLNMCVIANNFTSMCVHVCTGDKGAPPTTAATAATAGAGGAPPVGQGDVPMEGGMYVCSVDTLTA
jgi:hypothetical protein